MIEKLSLAFEGIDKDGFLALILNEQCTLENRCEYIESVVIVNTTREYLDSLNLAPVTFSYRFNDFILAPCDLPLTEWKELTAPALTSDVTGKTTDTLVNFTQAFHTNQFRMSNVRYGTYRRANTRQGGTVPNANLVEHEPSSTKRDWYLAPTAKDTSSYTIDRNGILTVNGPLLNYGTFQFVNWEDKIPKAILISNYYSANDTGSVGFFDKLTADWYTVSSYDQNQELYTIIERKDDPSRFFRLKLKRIRSYKITYTVYQLDVDVTHEINIGYQLQDDDIGKKWTFRSIRDVVSDEFSAPTTKLITPFTGYNVDIVALELFNENNTVADNIHFHRDFRDVENFDAPRFVPMNWSTDHLAPNPTYNNQVDKTKIMTKHGVGVLSCAGGVLGGFGKKSTLRLMTIASGDSNISAYVDAIIRWHNTKPIDPVTGQRRPTILNNSWGYQYHHDYHIPVADLQLVYKWTKDGPVTFHPTNTTYRTLTVNALHEVGVPIKRVYIGTAYQWCVNSPVKASNQETGANPWEAIWKSAEDNGIMVVVAASNSSGLVSGKHLSEYNDRYEVKANGKIYRSNRNWNYNQLGSQVLDTTYTSLTQIYPNWITNVAGTSNGVTVAALQMSDSQPHLEYSSCRGEGITVAAGGEKTLAATGFSGPILTDDYGGGYNFFSGTSAAAATVTGILSCMAEKFNYLRGYWPDPAALRYYLIRHSIKNKIRRVDPFNGSTGTVSAATTWKVEAFSSSIQTVKAITTSTFAMGGVVETLLGRTPNRIAYFDQTYAKPLDSTKFKPLPLDGVTLRHPFLNKRYAI